MKQLSAKRGVYLTRSCIVICISVLLASCISIGENADPVQLFRLEPITQANSKNEKPLRVGVTSGSLLNSQRLWVVQSGHRIAGFKGARWAMPLPELWEQTLIRSLEQSGVAIVVGNGGKYASLKVALRDFQVEVQESNAVVKVALQATFNKPDGETVHQLFGTNANASLNDSISISKAFNVANQEALLQLVEWVDASSI